MNFVLTPSKFFSTRRQDRAILLYALVKELNLNVGKIVEQSIMDYPKNNFLGNIPHPTLITLLCIKGGVTFNETEERCPRPSPFTLTRVLKALAHGEKVERAIKWKRETIELPREIAPAVEEEPEIEDLGGGGEFEDYLEQPVISPRDEKEIPTQNIAERGKKRAEE